MSMARASNLPMFQVPAILGAILMTSMVAEMASASSPPTATVRIGNFTFNDQILTVKPGTTVTWTNGDDIPHTVTSDSGVFKSKVLDTGDRFSFTFAKIGQYGYYCSLHPHMTGSIIVKA
jgi:plastocyanin